ncbi:MAG: hypothetical protein AAF798_03385 [Bacteroidota bacterium]
MLTRPSLLLEGTFSLDLDSGGITSTIKSDIFWAMRTSTQREMVPVNGSEIAYLGDISYEQLSGAELARLPYTTDPISANNDATNKLFNGAVFAVRTQSGQHAKVQVVSYGRDIELRFTTYRLPRNYHLLGTGYNQPEDITLSADGRHAYVTERTGNVLKVDLQDADRAKAATVATGMTAPHQMALFEAYGVVYVVEFAANGRLLRIDLDSGTQHVLATGLDRAIGLVVTSDQRFAYVSEQPSGADRIRRVDLTTGAVDDFVSGLQNPFFMTWADAGESAILLTERDPANQLTKVDLTTATPTVSRLNSVPFKPSSVAVVGATEVLVCSDQVVSRLDLAASVYTAVGPMFMGIGHVPADHIVGGYADTTPLTGYFFQVKDAPFGGTLPLMINHDKAFEQGARYYKILVDGVEQEDPWTNLQWSTSVNRFAARIKNPVGSGFFRLRKPGELWYRQWLGYMLRTAVLGNGLHTIRLQFYSDQNNASQLAGTGESIQVMIDNQVPLVSIDEILHHNTASGSLVPVGTCGIITEPSDRLSFAITARDTEGHLKSWSLTALWGDNQSAGIDSETYSASASGSRIWNGPAGVQVPSGGWQAIERRCAHTFRLVAWDRVIDGFRHIHKSTYHKSITLYLP